MSRLADPAEARPARQPARLDSLLGVAAVATAVTIDVVLREKKRQGS